jgi:hypothetical protein
MHIYIWSMPLSIFNTFEIDVSLINSYSLFGGEKGLVSVASISILFSIGQNEIGGVFVF